MIRLFFVAALSSIALWGLAALSALPLSQWASPFANPATLLPEQIFFAFGLMPRAGIALLIGGLLGLSGALMQAVLRNPLADPTTLGVASGAQLALVGATLLWPEALALGRGPVALFGGAVTAGLVMALGARRGFAPVTVTICGMLVGMLASAISTALTLGQGHYLLSLVIWNGGALSQDSWHGVFRLMATLVLGGVAAALLARPLVVLSLGGATAKALGAQVGLTRFAALSLAVILSGMVSAEVGLVGFVGLAAPALVRRLGARSVTQVLLWSPLAGALLLSVSDSALMALAALGGPEMPTGALTGLIGGPVLIALLPKLRNIVPPETERSDLIAPRATHPWKRVAAIVCVTLILTALSLLGGRGPDGWGIISGDIAATFLPLRATAILAAASAGALLALSGAVLQRLTANPMAAPEVLGVTGGAALGYAATLFLFSVPSPFTLAFGSSTGAAVTLIILSAYAMRSDMAPARLLLAGLAVGAFASALLAAVMASGDPRAWSLLGWLAGSASRASVSGALALSVMAVVGLGASLLVSRWFDILPLGAGVARGVGLPLGRVRLGLVLGAGLATGAASVLVGPVSFIGLMAPHIARSLGLVRPASFLAASWCLGVLLMTVAAFGARTASYPYDLPLGLFATLIGAPWLFVALLGRRHS
ncbi:Fe(3+)-hydroxamate ABC transporter permease FhuB [Pacificibacter marinus]|uniref:Iron(3+)-hydroxamate import system permease protein FhuB n=1 Tax=Pacificibacter marinus TaxID=658057 RepID=A0A1Y5R894_9RHOB|nr:Fe(3+)-hydroxamate ABC transporter permease FhuB [Pacificibacter marinus]SEK28092.1 iron complex transport system permease protein [Pacificibacter marinus]SLN11454.1 Iron(3+)-hydroxamate import system permease protein FhuB [Pacificibacter marinus]